MALEDDDHYGQEMLSDVLVAEREVEESFESLMRTLDSHSALTEVAESQFMLPGASFEAAVRPVVRAMYAGTGFVPEIANYSTESVAELVKKSLLAVARAIRQFFTKFVDYLSTVDLASTWLTRKLNAIERKVATSRGKEATEKQVTIGRMNRYLRVDRIYADDAIKLEAALHDLQNVVKLTGHDLINALCAGADNIPAAAKGKSGAALDEALTRLVLNMPLETLTSKFNMSGVSRFGRSGVMASKPLLAGKSVFFMRGKLAEKGTKAFRFHGFLLENTHEETAKFDDSRKFKTLLPEELGTIPGLTRDLLLSVSKASGVSVRQKIGKTRTHMESFVKHASENKDLTASDIEIIKRTTSAFTYWMHSVLRPLNNTTVSVCRGVISYCDASIKTYK